MNTRCLTIKTYSELIKLKTFQERFDYLDLNGTVGEETFGYDRYINQQLYISDKWKKTRYDIIIRDNACDLGIFGHDILQYAMIHHITPITAEDIIRGRDIVFDHDNLITVTRKTHNAIHYGDINNLYYEPVERKQHDTCPWRH